MMAAASRIPSLFRSPSAVTGPSLIKTPHPEGTKAWMSFVFIGSSSDSVFASALTGSAFAEVLMALDLSKLLLQADKESKTNNNTGTKINLCIIFTSDSITDFLYYRFHLNLAVRQMRRTQAK
ncbi:hypothetical protein D3C73_1287100 [compost metagenome]